MHMTISILSYARIRSDAEDKAEAILNQLAGENTDFDYGKVLNTVSAKSHKGKRAIKEALHWTKASFIGHLSIIRAALTKYTSNELFEQDGEPSPSMFRYHCYKVGEYRGSDTWLYDDDGEGIRDPKRLNNVLNKWPTLSESHIDPKDKVWITQADVHY